MRRAILIVNPNAGAAHRFHRQRAALEGVFAKHTVRIELFETTSAPESARLLATEAAHRCDLVIACGGDGTVHGVLQGVANTPACLGVLPFGTANALARNLGLPSDPVAALDKLLTFQPSSIPLGVATTPTGARYFTVMAGAGPDGRLIHEMKLAAKARGGRSAYYTEAARLFLTRSFPAFRIDLRTVGSEHWTTHEAAAIMVSRIPDLGGLFRGLTAESRLHHPHLIAKILAAPAHLSLPAWLASARSGLRIPNPWLATLAVEEVRCAESASTHQTFAQADGEPVGPIPISITIQQRALRLLMPPPHEHQP